MLEPWALRHKGWKKRPYLRWIERPSLRPACLLHATSEMEAASISTWFPQTPINTIPLGLAESPQPNYAAAREKLGWQRQERVVVFLSRLHEKKGLHLLIDAWAALPASLPARLVIVGEGDAAYVAPLKARGVASMRKIDWIGARWGEAKWEYLQGADLLCLPSFSENFGLVVIEALLVGTPVLTSPCTPWGELRGGDLPVTLTELDVPALSRALAANLSQPAQSEATRLAVHDTVVRRFGWSSLAPRYAELYRSLKSPA